MNIISPATDNTIRIMNLKYAVMICMAIAGLLALAGCQSKEDGAADAGMATRDGLQPDQVTSNAHFFLYSGGRTTTDLLADEIRQFTKLDSIIAYNLYVQFYDTTGQRSSTLTAKRGYIREKDNFLAVTGSVVVIGRDSVRLETEYLEWNGAKDSVVTDSFVIVIENGDTIMSYGFQSDPQLKDVTFKRQVSGRLTDVEKRENENK